jgi:ABC-type transport system substrate-binding protein
VPPEQIEGGTIDGRADVYSLGCVLYECLAGQRPFDRDSELSVVFAHLHEPPPRLSDLRPELPDAFDDVFATALAKSPQDRYQTCGELVEAALAAARGKSFLRRSVRRRRLILAASAVVVLAGAAIGGVLASREEGHHGRPTPFAPAVSLRPSGLNLIDARTHHVVGRIGIGKVPVADVAGWDVAFAGEAAWLLLPQKQRLVQVDAATHRVVGVVKLPWIPRGRLATGAGSLWLTQDGGPDVWRIDPRTGSIAARVTARGVSSEGGIAYGGGSLWLASGAGVVRVDPASGRLLHRFRIPGTSGDMRIVFADGAVWVARPGSGAVAKIDPTDDRIVAQTPLHGWVSDLAVGGGFVWVSIIPDGAVYELSENDLSVRDSRPAGRDPERISFGGGGLWVANSSAGAVTRLGEVSHVREQVATPRVEPATAAYAGGLVWVGAAPALPPLPPARGQDLEVAGAGVPWDPAHNGLWDEQVLYATCAKLLDYPDAAGAAGARLRPEIAAAMPTVSREGRTYTFRIRPGFRFSPPSNEPVTAETFRHTIERQIATSQRDSGIDPYVSDIVGAAAFYAGKARHVSGIAVHGNRLAITLVKPAGDFTKRIAMPRFCPVPLSVPTRGGGDRPLPSAGPYYISSSEGGRSVLERNPNYHGNRPRRSARIVFRENVSEALAVTLADRGSVDLLPASAAGDLLSPGGVLDRKAAGMDPERRQYVLYQAPLVDYLVFNTRRPLFRHLRLRQAVNYALDRRALATAFGDAPADRIVPPAVPGYPAGRIFPLRPNLAAARRLVGDSGRHAVLYICGDAREGKLAQIIRNNLARIRMAVSVVDDQNCPDTPEVVRRTSKADLLLVQAWPWLEADEREPAEVLDKALTKSVYGAPLPPGPWSAASFRKRLDDARPLRGRARAPAYRSLVDELTRAAPFAVFGSWVWPEYFSPKVGCKVFQSVYGVADLGALCKTA